MSQIAVHNDIVGGSTLPHCQPNIIVQPLTALQILLHSAKAQIYASVMPVMHACADGLWHISSAYLAMVAEYTGLPAI